MSILEFTEEECDEEAAEHQAHRQQGRVGVGPFNLKLMNGDVAV